MLVPRDTQLSSNHDDQVFFVGVIITSNTEIVI